MGKYIKLVGISENPVSSEDLDFDENAKAIKDIKQHKVPSKCPALMGTYGDISKCLALMGTYGDTSENQVDYNPCFDGVYLSSVR